jgi:hypothetical protein
MDKIEIFINENKNKLPRQNFANFLDANYFDGIDPSIWNEIFSENLEIGEEE